MEITPDIIEYVDEHVRAEVRKYSSLNSEDESDLRQEVYIQLMQCDKKPKNLKQYIGWEAWKTVKNYVLREDNRRRLEDEHSDEIRAGTTPTLTKQWAGGPDEELQAEQELLARWKSLTPLLQLIAKRTFFGVVEHPRKVARDLGTTEAAVNMARSRIKKTLFGEDKDGK